MFQRVMRVLATTENTQSHGVNRVYTEVIRAKHAWPLHISYKKLGTHPGSICLILQAVGLCAPDNECDTTSHLRVLCARKQRTKISNYTSSNDVYACTLKTRTHSFFLFF